jgi:UDP-N-acetylglucosamine 2-epimerase (non-hydrolysing)
VQALPQQNFTFDGHVGRQEFDRMPEEINRIVADHISDQLFAPTEISHQNLLREGIAAEKITVTGNTVDAVRRYKDRQSIL